MEAKKQVSLTQYNTFGVSVNTPLFAEVRSSLELQEVLKDPRFEDALILGGGSNVLLLQDLSRSVIKISIPGIRIMEETEQTAIVSAGAGVVWHDLVMWCIANNLGGIENLSLIPGLVGAAPIQNIGAYGVELSDVFHNAIGIGRKTGDSKIFEAEDCEFGYRDSIFKNELKDEYVITTLRLSLTKSQHQLHLDYGGITQTLDEMGVTNPTIDDVAKAVIRIRSSKLPDPTKLGNAGSFFKNPVVLKDKAAQIAELYPDMPSYSIDNQYTKIPAGWLIEKAGFKGKIFGNVGMHKNQALVLVNYGAATGAELWEHAQRIMDAVLSTFDIELEPEVNLIN
ncbi:MAG: UDP-N-acetylmuramate dehydrogenase [Flavobacteriaceae bacterium]